MMILAATDLSGRSHLAVRRAAMLAQERRAELALVHVVEEDQPPELIAIERREVESLLRGQVQTIVGAGTVPCKPVVIPGDPFDGILRAATSMGADLIVMGAPRRQLLRDIFVGTTVERVIRGGVAPVLMVSAEAEQPYKSAVAGVDASAASAHALHTAERLGFVQDLDVKLVHAFSPIAKGKMAMAGLKAASISEHVEFERGRARTKIEEMLAAERLGDSLWSLDVEEGSPAEVIDRIVAAADADMVVVGTHGRSGIAKALVGSVAEELLRTVRVDVLAVPLAPDARDPHRLDKA